MSQTHKGVESSLAGAMSLVGGDLCLDFVNTVGGRRPDIIREKLVAYSDLVAWARHTGILTAAEAAHLIRVASGHPRVARHALAHARAFREALYKTLVAALEGRSPRGSDLQLLNAVTADAHGHTRLVLQEGKFEWGWEQPGDALDRILWPVAQSAARLLTSDRLSRVRQCGGPDCGWLFVDLSKNHSRRWCEMSECGNRAKARRHYHRTMHPTAAE